MSEQLTLDEAMAVIHAQSNLLDEIRVRWLVLLADGHTDETRALNNAWLTLGAKPFFKRWFDQSLPVLQGKLSLYPAQVDGEALERALIKLNGEERVKA